jgi:two-component system, NarL family, nitrate/nitrite response regulator NarL
VGINMRADTRVLVADDHPVFRRGLALALSDLGFGRVDAVEDGEQVLKACEMQSYDVVVLDVKMPHLNGLEVARCLRAASTGSMPGPKVIIMSAFDQPALIRAGTQMGVDAYLTKVAEPARLATLIDALVEGTASPPTSGSTSSPGIELLTQRERQVLHHLCKGLSAKAIGSALDISPETVRDHLTRLYAKLNVRDRAAAVDVAHRLGWVALEDLRAETDIERR